ncbi:nucleotidyltransferase family protein [Reyranella sp.]|uniref:nucleotidyltransferase family protein n=1 Tax=Reyranella sp. TaxID=1929291 RepID=UPI003BA92DC2
MTSEEFFRLIDLHRSELASVGVRRLGVYGSVARDEAREDSDIDILVEFEETPDLFQMAALRDRLCEILGRPVDLATPRGLKPRLRDRVLNEVRYAA